MSVSKDTNSSKRNESFIPREHGSELSKDKEARICKRFMGILPAFRDVFSGETHLSCEKDGTLAATHQVDFLPSKWLTCNVDNSQCKLKDCIEKGYVVMGHFFNQEDAAQLLPH